MTVSAMSKYVSSLTTVCKQSAIRSTRLALSQKQWLPPPHTLQAPAPHMQYQRGYSSSSSSSAPTHIPRRPARDLRGKVAVVTGAGSQGLEIGNGRATSILLAEDGASVVCVDKDLSLARKTVEMINSASPGTGRTSTTITQSPGKRPKPSAALHACRTHHHTCPATHHCSISATGGEITPGSAIALSADVTNPRDCESIITQTLATFGRLDILINVVGILGPKGTAVDVDLAEWTRGLEINVTSMMLMSRYAIPAMLLPPNRPENTRIGGKEHHHHSREGRDATTSPVKGGSIVNIGSVAGLRGGTPHLLYPTSKGAVVNMTRAMAAQHGREGIRVNCVCPGQFVN